MRRGRYEEDATRREGRGGRGARNVATKQPCSVINGCFSFSPCDVRSRIEGLAMRCRAKTRNKTNRKTNRAIAEGVTTTGKEMTEMWAYEKGAERKMKR